MIYESINEYTGKLNNQQINIKDTSKYSQNQLKTHKLLEFYLLNDNQNIQSKFSNLSYYAKFKLIYSLGYYSLLLKFPEVVDEKCNADKFLQELKLFIISEQIEDSKFLTIANQVMTLCLYKTQIRERERTNLNLSQEKLKITISIIITLLTCCFIIYYSLNSSKNITNNEIHSHDLMNSTQIQSIFEILQLQIDIISNLNQTTQKQIKNIISNYNKDIQNINKTLNSLQNKINIIENKYPNYNMKLKQQQQEEKSPLYYYGEDPGQKPKYFIIFLIYLEFTFIYWHFS